MRIPDNGRRVLRGYRLTALLLALSVLSPFAAQAEIFKCVAANGDMTFSQTPCLKVDKQDKVPIEESEETIPTRHPDSDKSNGSDGTVYEPAKIAYATKAPRLAQLQDLNKQQPENAALHAQKFQADARDEEYRLQCENNVKAQINSINSQMRSSYSSSLVDSLTKKRRALENRLNDC